jgi:alpha-beta hydrolase superfamily lysophospholipase
MTMPLPPSPRGVSGVISAVISALFGCLVASLALPPPVAAQPAAPAAGKAAGKPGAEEPPPEPEALTFATTDGVEIAAWFFAPPGDDPPLATVILLHDLGGSHETVEPLAKALQAGGCAVVGLDLRGHGKSVIPKTPRAAAGDQSGLLKSRDFVSMIATAGGRLREQSAIRGDIEVVRNWLKRQAEAGKLDLDKLYLVGSGVGAAVAAGWTVNDAAWPAIASGPQGGDVRGLVMIDPAFVTRGFSIAKPLGVEPVKTRLPIMVITGGGDRDATKVFDQLKRARPTAWFDSRAYDAETRRNTSPAKDSDASLLFLKLGSRLSGDKLAAARSGDPRQLDPAGLILAFLKTTAGRSR